MTTSSNLSVFATYNILQEYNGVKWKEQEAITLAAHSLNGEILKESTKNGTWQQHSNWNERKDTMVKVIKTFSPPVLCLQEVSPQMMLDLRKGLHNLYNIALEAYHKSPGRTGEQLYGNAIIYDITKATLSDTYTIFHTESETSKRVAPVALFDISDRMISVASVHLRGYNIQNPDLAAKQKAKKPGFKELETYVDKLKGEESDLDGIVIAGDFNQGPSEEHFPYYRPAFLKNEKFQCDGDLSVTRPESKERLDWVFYREVKEKGRVEHLNPMGWEKTQLEQINRPSDHLMTGTEFIWA